MKRGGGLDASARVATSPKRHHYLPQFYLEYFSRDGFLWLYDRELKQYRRQAPRNTMVQGHYYTFQEDSGTKNTEIEGLLAMIEGASKPIISKIEEDRAISLEEMKTLTLFIAFLKNRGPDFEKQVNQLMFHEVRSTARYITSSEAHTESILRRYEADTGKRVSVTAKELVDFVEGDDYDVEVHRNESLKAMLRSSLSVAQSLLQMDWKFIRAPKESSFVTSDNPFIIAPVGAGILTPRARKIIPLTARTTMVIFNRGERIGTFKASEDEVRLINLALTRRSLRFVVAKDEALLRSLVRKTRLSKSSQTGRSDSRTPSE